MNKSKIFGTDLTVIQSLLLALAKSEEEVINIKTALNETIARVGREAIGEQEGDGHYMASREPDGSFSIFWEPEITPVKEGDSNDPK